MTKITLPKLTAADRQSFFDALNQYLVPAYFDSVQYENGTDGTTFETIDEGAARVAVYIKNGVRAMAIDMYYAASATSAPQPKIRIAGAAGITVNLTGGTEINCNSSNYLRSVIVDANHLWVGSLDAATGKIYGSGGFWTQLLLERRANGDVDAVRVYTDTQTTTSYYVSIYTIGVGRTASANDMQPAPAYLRKAAYNQNVRERASTYTELAKLFVEDAGDSTLLDTYLILAASSTDMLATGTLVLGGVTYNVIGVIAYTE